MIYQRNLLTAFTAVFVLQGCAGFEPAEPPPIPPVIDRQLIEVDTSPLDIKDAVRLGVLSSTNVQEAELGIRQSGNEVRIARAAFYPELYADVSPGTGDGLIANAGAGIRYTLFDFGERAAALNGTVIGVQVSRYELLGQIEEAAKEVAAKYIYLSIENEQVDVALDYQRSVAALEDRVRARVDIGIASSVDINEVETAIVQAETEVVEARADRSNALEDLGSTLGLVPDGVFSPSKIQQMLSIDTVPSDDLEYLAYPRVAALEAQVEQAEYEQQAVQAGLLPRIGVQLGVNVGLDIEDGFTGQGVTAGPEISEVFSLGGGRQERIQNAEIAVRIARQKRDEEIRLARLEAVQAQTALSASIQRFAQRQRVVGLTIDTRDLMLGEYDVGTRSLRDLLDAEERIYRAKVDANEARRTQLEARLRYIAAANRLSDYLYEISD